MGASAWHDPVEAVDQSMDLPFSAPPAWVGSKSEAWKGQVTHKHRSRHLAHRWTARWHLGTLEDIAALGAVAEKRGERCRSEVVRARDPESQALLRPCTRGSRPTTRQPPLPLE